MPGQRIKFRGQYQPYAITGVRPWDTAPVKPRRGPRYRPTVTCQEEGLTCSSCSRPILMGQRMWTTPKGTKRHQQC
jgi:hypothetical protein